MYVLIVKREEESYNYGCCCCSTNYREIAEPIAYFSTREKVDTFIESCRRKGSKVNFKASSPLGQIEEYEVKEVTVLDPESYLTM